MTERDDIPYFSGSRPKPRASSAPEPASGSVPPVISTPSKPEASPPADTPSELRATETQDVSIAEDARPPTDDTPIAAEPHADSSEVSPIDESAGSSIRIPRYSARTKVVALAGGLIAIVALLLGASLALYPLREVSTPFIVARTPAAAERILDSRELAAGDAHFVATRDFAPGLIMEQSPQTPTQLKPGSPVDVVIATGTANVVVPDVFLADEATAQKRVRSALFVPVVINAYSSDVSVGNVVSQLPRAGDMAFTGSPLFVVVSMGPGMPGVVVPALVGKPHKVAASLLTSESIFPRTLIVDSASVAPDTVVDQTPAAGTILPVGSSVAISLTSP